MKADNAVGLAKFRNFIRLLDRLKKDKKCHIEFIDDNSEVECSFSADAGSYDIIDKHIRFQGHFRLGIGLLVGFLAGLFAAYVVFPSSATYLYSSENGLIPPQYDLLFKSRKPYEQAIQILTHETPGEKRRYGGPYRGKKMCYTAKVNDSTKIELWYQLADKSLITNISQEIGGEYIRNAVQEGMDNSGIDSAAKYYAGNEESNVANQVSDAISRSTIMKVEQGFLSQPVIRIIIDGDDAEVYYTNFLPWSGSFDEDFSIEDSDPANVKSKDNTKDGRNLRVPIPRDSDAFQFALNQFVDDFIESKIVYQ